MNTPKVLVVDDDPFLVDVCAQVLEDAGYAVEVASNGREALDRVYSNGFELILLDALMPVLDGISVCKQTKVDPRTKDIAVVIMSASEARLEEGRTCADGVLAKPFRLDHLLEIVGHFAD